MAGTWRPLRRTADATTIERNWADLPQELLLLVSKKLLEILDFVRFRAVCPRWRSSASDLPLRLLWFVRKCGPGRAEILSICSRCFPNDASRLRLIDCSELMNKWIILSWYRYILVFDERNNSLSLLNPFTKREIALPPINVKIALPSINVSIGTDPIGNGECVVISMLNKSSKFNTLGFCKIGNDNWKTLELKEWPCVYTYYNGMFFVYSKETQVTNVTDVTTGSFQFVILPPERSILSLLEFCSFVESCGKLLLISFRRFRFKSQLVNKYRPKIHEFDYGNGNPKWVKINSIGDQFLILHDLYGGLSLKASDFPGFRPNCIYFLGYNGRRDNFNSYLVKFDISDGSVEKLPFPNDVELFFLPSLQ